MLASCLDSKLEHDKHKHTKAKEEAKKKEYSDYNRPPQWLHLGHLAIFQLVDRVEEEDDPCFVSFHLGNGSNIGLALAVGQVLQKHKFTVLDDAMALCN